MSINVTEEVHPMTNSILTSTKKILGLAEEYTAFDLDVITHINAVLSDLHQLGVGPDAGFRITGADETWDAFLGDDARTNQVLSYVYLRVRMLFDPPTTGPLIGAVEKQIEEMAWRINVAVDTRPLVDPDAPTFPVVLDGGGA